MSPELLKLHVSQLTRTLNRSKTNKYADSRKQDYHEQLIELFGKIREVDFSKLSYPEQLDAKRILDFCFLSIEFLDNSTLVNIPYEIVYSLEKALNEWDKTDKYIIVTSLQNNIVSYSFNPLLALYEPTYDLIFANYGIKFKHRLIQINLPKYLAFDYLANVVLFHELGHFIDRKYLISARLALTFKSTIKERRHFEEFFADIFAAMYIGSASNYYLNYIAHNAPDSDTHPATDNRIKVVNDFLGSVSTNDVLNKIIFATQAITGNKLTINTDKPSDQDFKQFIPAILKTDNQLYSIFEVGWNLWLSEIEEYEKNNIAQEDKYQIINNLIEKSISNYMISEKWNKHVPNKE
jgi:hypothetical protein